MTILRPWLRAPDGKDSPCPGDDTAARILNAPRRRGPWGLPAEPTDDKHEQRIEPDPSVVVAATAVIGVMILGLMVTWW